MTSPLSGLVANSNVLDPLADAIISPIKKVVNAKSDSDEQRASNFSLKDWPDEKVCKLAVRVDLAEWETSESFKVYVQEAISRNFSASDCFFRSGAAERLDKKTRADAEVHSPPSTSKVISPPRILSGSLKSSDIIDGDTISIAGERVRLHGIDAPELDQTCDIQGKKLKCGQLAKEVLSGFDRGK